MQALVGQLQIGAGNAAVARLLSRAGGSASAAGPSAPVESPQAPAEAAAVVAGPRYTVMVGGESLEQVGAEAAAAALASHLRQLDGAFARGSEKLDFLWESYMDQWFVGGVIDLLGGPEFPMPDIWAYPMASLAVARASVTVAQSKARWAREFRESGREDLADQTATLEREAGQDLATAARDLDEAAEALREAQDRLDEFVEGTVKAGDRVVTGLRVAVVAGSVASMALGGAGVARAGFGGLLKIAAGSGAAGGVYGTGSDLAEQASEVHHDQRKGIDVGRALRRGAIDAVTGFVGSLTGGVFTKAFERAVGGYLSSSVADDVLVELGRQMGLAGPLPRTYLQTGGQRLAAEVLGEMGAAPLSAAVSVLVERIAGGGPLPASAEEWVDMILAETVESGALQLALGAVVRRRGAAPDSRPGPESGESGAGGRPAAASPEAVAPAGRAAAAELETSAKAASQTGHVHVTEYGRIFSCSSPCTEMRSKYGEIIASDSKLSDRLADIERRAAGVEKGAKAELQALANEARELDALLAKAAREARAKKIVAWLPTLHERFPILKDNPLDVEAIARIIEKADPGQLKGQVFEELMNRQVKRMLATGAGRSALAGGRAGEALEFIPGHRILDGEGELFTDGMIVIRHGDEIEVVTILEAKAGRASSRGLGSAYKGLQGAKDEKTGAFKSLEELKAEGVTRKRDLIEARLEAIGELTARNPKKYGKLTQAEIDKHFKGDVDKTLGQLPTTEYGQASHDIERLVELGVQIDGKPVKVRPSGRGSTQVKGVVPGDVPTAALEQRVAGEGPKQQGLDFEVMKLDEVSSKQVQQIGDEIAQRALAPTP